jgi:hypothetical protein
MNYMMLIDYPTMSVAHSGSQPLIFVKTTVAIY